MTPTMVPGDHSQLFLSCRTLLIKEDVWYYAYAIDPPRWELEEQCVLYRGHLQFYTKTPDHTHSEYVVDEVLGTFTMFFPYPWSSLEEAMIEYIHLSDAVLLLSSNKDAIRTAVLKRLAKP